MYGLIGSFRSVAGKRAELAAVLLTDIDALPGCKSYVVQEDLTEQDTLWVTEVWDDPASHKASLDLPAVKAAIAKAMPLVAGYGEHRELKVLWGPRSIGRPKVSVTQ
jgi:quinol monooxygenase YgiN